MGVLESRVVAAGQTGRASGDLTYGNPTTYGKLESMYGADKARLVAQSQVAALAHVKQVTSQLESGCMARDRTRLHCIVRWGSWCHIYYSAGASVPGTCLVAPQTDGVLYVWSPAVTITVATEQTSNADIRWFATGHQGGAHRLQLP